MRRILQFLQRSRLFLLLLVLLGFCAYLLARQQPIYRSAAFSSAQRWAAFWVETTANVRSYLYLAKQNRQLRQENAHLHSLLAKSRQLNYFTADKGSPPEAVAGRLQYISARVLSNSVGFFENYLTLDKGTADGVEPGQGVVGAAGVVGVVQAASDHYSVVISLLHAGQFISSSIGKERTLCTTRWLGDRPSIANVEYVPRHVVIAEGDSVWTSGYNAVFPPQVPIGVVTMADLRPEASFYTIEIHLETDFTQLEYVHIIKNYQADQLDSLQQGQL